MCNCNTKRPGHSIWCQSVKESVKRQEEAEILDELTEIGQKHGLGYDCEKCEDGRIEFWFSGYGPPAYRTYFKRAKIPCPKCGR